MGSVGEERVLKRDLHQYGRRARTDGPYADNLDVDVIVVGGGFGGIHALYECRKLGFKTVMFEAGTGYGGTWRWVSFACPYQLPWQVTEHLPRISTPVHV